MQVNGILDAKWMQSASCCVLLVEAVQVERDVLHVAWRGGASGEGRHPARCLEKRRRWRGPSCMLLGGAVRVERRPACCWEERCKLRETLSCMLLDGAVRMVGKCRECRRGVRAQHAPFHAAGTRPTRAVPRREHAPLAIVRARRFPPQMHAKHASLPAADVHRHPPRARVASRRRCTPRARRYRLETIALSGDIRFAPLLCTKVHFSQQAL